MTLQKGVRSDGSDTTDSEGERTGSHPEPVIGRVSFHPKPVRPPGHGYFPDPIVGKVRNLYDGRGGGETFL